MLLNNFFEIIKLEVSQDCRDVRAEVKLNPGHEIFKGHFPELPVVPGVCTIEMIKEILSEVLMKNMTLIYSNTVKLHNPINPEFNEFLTFSFQVNRDNEDMINVSCEVFFESLKFCSFRGDFKII